MLASLWIGVPSGDRFIASDLDIAEQLALDLDEVVDEVVARVVEGTLLLTFGDRADTVLGFKTEAQIFAPTTRKLLEKYFKGL